MAPKRKASSIYAENDSSVDSSQSHKKVNTASDPPLLAPSTAFPPLKRGRGRPKSPVKALLTPRATSPEVSSTHQSLHDLQLTPTPARPPKAKAASTPKSTPKRKSKPILTSAPTQRLYPYVFGINDDEQLGLGPGEKADQVSSPSLNNLLSWHGIAQVALGSAHGVALTNNDKVLTWGCDDFGQLGREMGHDHTPLHHRCIPEEVDDTFPAGTVITQVAASAHASFALTETGEVYGWGTFRNNEGILGLISNSSPRSTPARASTTSKTTSTAQATLTPCYTPTLLPSLSSITSLATSASANHLLALSSTGTVHALGAGEQNQLGRRLTERNKMHGLSAGKVKFKGPPGEGKASIESIAVGDESSFAVDSQARVWSWGRDAFGLFGHALDDEGGTPNKGRDSALPRLCAASAGLEVVEVRVGRDHVIAESADGGCVSWGRVDGLCLGHSVSALGELRCRGNVLPVGEWAASGTKDISLEEESVTEGPHALPRAQHVGFPGPGTAKGKGMDSVRVEKLATSATTSYALVTRGDAERSYAWGDLHGVRKGGGESDAPVPIDLSAVHRDNRRVVDIVVGGKGFGVILAVDD